MIETHKQSEFHKRKEARTRYYFKFIYRKKMKTCGACSGSGKYDTWIKGKGVPDCSMCEGTGRVREI